MSVVHVVAIFAFNGAAEILFFALRDFAIFFLLGFALLFSRWEIAEHRDRHEGIRHDEELF